MKYSRFIISNFKGIDEITIDFSNNRVITLVGLNESGKTTIMEAIHLFYKMLKGDEPSESELKTLRPKGAGFTGNIKITGELVLEEIDKKKINKYWKHDLNLSGWWILVPFVNSLLWLGGFFLRGISGENKYGQPPTNDTSLTEALFAPQPLPQTK